MLNDLFDIFERDRRSHRWKPRRGLRGQFSRLVNSDLDGGDCARDHIGNLGERRRHDGDRYSRRERGMADFDD